MNETAKDAVCEEILRIMETYHRQEASAGGVDTPGGLEHMGDVWRMLRRWEEMLTAPEPQVPQSQKAR